MFIKEIQLENFKCFENSTFQFEKQFTTIIGDNGSGKTALLDGIASTLKSILPNEYVGFEIDEIRHISNQMGSKSNIQLQIPVVTKSIIKWDFFKKDTIVQVGLERDLSKTQTAPNTNISKDVHKIRTIISTNESNVNFQMPFIGYYRTNRLWKLKNHKEVELYPIASRWKPYEDCLKPQINSELLVEWFKRMELISFQKNKHTPELQAVKKAMIQAIKGLHPNKEIEVYFSAENDELMINIGGGKELPVRLLSDGYRNTLGMIADIAYRMAELNPHLTTNSPGIVLIDELDLHLHPKWQRHIVGDLKRIFPNCQFIVTTHSPFIIQSLKSGELLKLDETPELEYDDFTKKGIEDITIEYQDLKDDKIRSVDFEEMLKVAEEYYDLIEQGKTNGELAPLRQRLTELEEKYSEEPAFVAVLRAERKFKKI